MPIQVTERYTLRYRSKRERYEQYRTVLFPLWERLNARLAERVGGDLDDLPCFVANEIADEETRRVEKVGHRWLREESGLARVVLRPRDEEDEAYLRRDPTGCSWAAAMRVRQAWRVATGYRTPEQIRTDIPYYQELGPGPHFGKVYGD